MLKEPELKTGCEEGALMGREAAKALASIVPSVTTRYKMLVSDLDNTLLDENKQICGADLAAIRRLTDAGFIFTLATGRGPWSIMKLYKEVGANAPVIIFNGARIVDFADNQRVIFSRVMQREPAMRAIKFAAHLNTTVMAFAGENCIAQGRDRWVDFYESATSSACLLVEDLLEHVAQLPEGMEITKLIFFSEPSERDGLIQRLSREFPEFSCVGSTPNYSEVLPFGISKGFALQKLAKYLGIEMDAVVAIGDAPNDVEMLTAAGFAAAVGNADDVVKAAADIIVKPAGKGAIAEIISIAFGL